MSHKIVVVGSSNVDLIMQMERMPKVGETVLGGAFTQAFGGKGANQAVGAARAGASVCFVSCLGQDDFAKGLLNSFEQDGIDPQYITQKKDVATGTALILLDAQGQNSIAVAPGANYKLGRSEIDAAHAAFEEAKFLLLQCEIHPIALEYSIQKAWDLDKRTILNLAPARSLSDALLSKLYLLIVNESEAAFLVESSVETLDDAKIAAHQLLQKVNYGVIVTLGAKGAYVLTKDAEFTIPAFEVAAIDTTAAGDVFCGALTAALAEEQDLENAVRFGSAAAAIAVTRLGAQPSVPNRAEIEQLLQQ